MALIKCPECGREISESAISCPNCGYVIGKTKFCQFCGEKVPEDSVICTKCGRQIESTDLRNNNGGIVINNVSNSSSSASASATAQNVNVSQMAYGLKRIDKVVALLLCIFLGYFGAHKFYEGKIGMGILYILTMGLFGIGWMIDIVAIAMKPNPYYV